MAATLKTIAKETGLSAMTVSRILNNEGEGHREDTRQHVLETARRLGYRVNSSAQAIRRGRSGFIALVLSTVGYHSLLPAELLDGIHDALAAHDRHLVVTKIPDEKLTSEEFVPRILRESTAEGLLINYNSNTPQRLIELIQQHQIPAIWINAKQSSDCAYPDDLRAGEQAVEELYQLGHRRIAYVSRRVSHYSATDRCAGYQAAMRARGLEPIVIWQPEGNAPKGSDSDRVHWLAAPDRPTSVIAYSRESVSPVLSAAARLGLRVPEDLSILTFAARPFRDFDLEIDALILPEYAMGQASVEMLLEKVADPSVRLPARALPLRYKPGETCAPVK